MRPVPQPTWDAFQDANAIFEEKQGERRERLRALRPTIRSAFARYREQAMAQEISKLCPATNIDRESGKDLVHCYEKPSESMKALRRQLNRLLVHRYCPYCGFGEVTELDHYLPKREFPEFSVCAYNLIPCCHRCNNLRGSHDGSKQHGPSVIHVFYEEIDTEREHLQALLTLDGDDVEVVFSVQLDESRPFSRRFKGHFETLRLAERLPDETDGELQEFVSDLRGFREWCSEGQDSVAFVQSMASQRAESRQKRHGANHWTAAFYRAAMDSADVARLLLRKGTPT